jgi:hypothetical protein
MTLTSETGVHRGIESIGHLPLQQINQEGSIGVCWTVTVGLLVNPEAAGRRVDKGPSGEDNEVSWSDVLRFVYNTTIFCRVFYPFAGSGEIRVSCDDLKTALSLRRWCGQVAMPSSS